MHIKLTRSEYKSALRTNEQYMMDNETLDKLEIVFAIPQTDHVYLSFAEYNQIIPLIPTYG